MDFAADGMSPVGAGDEAIHNGPGQKAWNALPKPSTGAPD